ncbi:MAG: 50S ribosomal protein L20, partial [Candidatus Delongbacteria bacterium]|nr:50S ribosomal protein L20 [Candidatus Delongbacteria bacterium]
NGMKYSEFMHKLSEKDIKLDRKVLAHMAVHDAAGFTTLVESVR